MTEKSDRNILRRAACWLKQNFAVSSKEVGQQALTGLLRQNPVLVLLLGLCPALATTTALQSGLAMGLATAVVLICSNLTISLLRKQIPGEVRIAAFLVIIALFSTTVDLLMQALFPALSDTLGLYIPLIAVNCIVLGRTEAFASQRTPGPALLDGLFNGLGFTAALAVLGAIREILGAGTVWDHPIPVLSSAPARMLLAPCGGFLVLGCLAALSQHLLRKRKGGGKA